MNGHLLIQIVEEASSSFQWERESFQSINEPARGAWRDGSKKFQLPLKLHSDRRENVTSCDGTEQETLSLHSAKALMKLSLSGSF